MILAGLIIALGVVVDDAIIDVENILRRLRLARSEGSTRSTAAIILDASLEVRSPIIYATFIIVAAAIPIFLLHGLTASFFRPLMSAYTLAIAASLVVGLVNGVLIAYLNLSSFIVTLGMFAVARSLAQVLSENHMIYQFGPDEKLFAHVGGGTMFGIANPFVILLVLTIVFMIAFRYTSWGRWVYAIGGNEQAARLTGVPVNRVKLSVYMLSGLMSGISAVLLVGWQGAAINAMGTGYELRAIASSVIGGTDLMGGAGGAYGAFIGAALIEVIRNSLLLAGVDANWEGTFVGLFIVLAVMLSRFRGMRSG
jgi:ribose transport system permease protein